MDPLPRSRSLTALRKPSETGMTALRKPSETGMTLRRVRCRYRFFSVNLN